MPPSSEINGDENPQLTLADAVNQIHQLALQAIDIANEAKLGFLVYLLMVVARDSKGIATASSAKRTIPKRMMKQPSRRSDSNNA